MAEKPKEKAEKAEVIFVKSKVRDYVHSKECNAASDMLDGDSLDKIIKELLDKAIERKRTTGKPSWQKTFKIEFTNF